MLGAPEDATADTTQVHVEVDGRVAGVIHLRDVARATAAAAVAALRARGVRGCVIDWTGLLDFYGKWGFKPYRRYLFIRKTLES